MNKKLLFLAALAAAATTAFTGCSSDEEIVIPDSNQVVTESPFTFNVSVDNGTFTNTPSPSQSARSLDIVTRAATTGANVFDSDGAGFTLYGFQGDNLAEAIDGAAYTNNGGTWSTGAQWADITDKCYFYALSYAGKASTALGKSNVADVPAGSAKDAVKFTYKLPVSGNAFDTDNQEDLLVACETTGLTSGTVPLAFSHALSNLELKLALINNTFNEGVYSQAAADFNRNQFYFIKSITIHNLPIKGTYTYGAATPWAVDKDNDGTGDIVISYDKGLILPAMSYDEKGAAMYGSEWDATKQAWKAAESADPTNTTARRTFEKSCYTDIFSGDASVMVIPHEITPWPSGSNLNTTTHTYITIHGFIGLVDNNERKTENQSYTFTDEELGEIREAIDFVAGLGLEDEFVGPLTPKLKQLYIDSEEADEEDDDFESACLTWVNDNCCWPLGLEYKTSNGIFSITCNPFSASDEVVYGGEDGYVKIPALNFQPNKKYTFYVGLKLNTVCTDETGKTITGVVF